MQTRHDDPVNVPELSFELDSRERSLRAQLQDESFLGALREAIEDDAGEPGAQIANLALEGRQPWAWTNPGFHSAG